MGIRLIKKNEGTDGFPHVWELQAQQAKETLEGLTRKFGDADRLEFSIHNYPHRHECDAYVTVDGDPFITAEFEGGSHGGIRWHCYEDDVSDMRLDPGDTDAAKNMILHFKDDILNALESLYGFGAIADEGGRCPEGSLPTREYHTDRRNAKECAMALDTYVARPMHAFQVETRISDNGRTVELGGLDISGEWHPYFTFEFDGDHCHISSSISDNNWTEKVSAYSSIDHLVASVCDRIIDALELIL